MHKSMCITMYINVLILYFTLGIKDDLETLTTDQMEKLDTILYFIIHYKQ